jgi:anti-sigma regulatory factor (Ser/Thr protein kinase)
VTDAISLSIPAPPDLLMVVRLAASALASRAGFDADTVEDVRLATDEICLAAAPDGAKGRLEISMTSDVGLFEMRCTLVGDPGPESVTGRDPASPPAASSLSRALLDVLVDDYGIEDGLAPTAWYRVRRSSRPA